MQAAELLTSYCKEQALNLPFLRQTRLDIVRYYINISTKNQPWKEAFLYGVTTAEGKWECEVTKINTNF